MISQSKERNIISQLASTQKLHESYLLLRKKRTTKNNIASQHDDFWALSLAWDTIKKDTRISLQNGDYQISPLKLYTKGEHLLSKWDSLDWIILKSLSTQLKGILLAPFVSHANVYSISGDNKQSGIKKCLRAVSNKLNNKAANFVFKTDIKDFYQSIDPKILMNKLKLHIQDTRVINLLEQYTSRIEDFNGEYRNCTGLPKGCPLAPVLANFYLLSLDKACNTPGIFYIRYMDDFLIITAKRWKLKMAIKSIHSELKNLCLTLSKKKTTICRVTKRFTFLGYSLSENEGLRLSRETLKRHRNKLKRLYEQKRSNDLLRVYVMHFWRWVKSGVDDIIDTNYLNNVMLLYINSYFKLAK